MMTKRSIAVLWSLLLLSFCAVAQDPAVDDVYEDNDTVATAVLLQPGTYSLQCLDTDVFCVDCPQGGLLTIDLQYDTTNAELSLGVVGSSTGYTLTLRPVRGTPAYTLQITVTSQPPGHGGIALNTVPVTIENISTLWGGISLLDAGATVNLDAGLMSIVTGELATGELLALSVEPTVAIDSSAGNVAIDNNVGNIEIAAGNSVTLVAGTTVAIGDNADNINLDSMVTTGGITAVDGAGVAVSDSSSSGNIEITSTDILAVNDGVAAGSAVGSAGSIQLTAAVNDGVVTVSAGGSAGSVQITGTGIDTTASDILTTGGNSTVTLVAADSPAYLGAAGYISLDSLPVVQATSEPDVDALLVVNTVRGWNLLSTPTDIEVTDLLVTGVDSVSCWDRIAQRYKIKTDMLYAQDGFWLFAKKPGIAFMLRATTHVDLTLVPGWNLVGPSQETPIEEVEGVSGSCWYWSRKGYVAEEEMLHPGVGYWIRSE